LKENVLAIHSNDDVKGYFVGQGKKVQKKGSHKGCPYRFDQDLKFPDRK
jgi:hypothetical protein